MPFFFNFIGFLFLLGNRIKGERITTEIHTPFLISHLTAYAVSGYEVSIYCQKKHYCRMYGAWFIPNQNFVTYHVFSIASNTAPSVLKRACEIDVHLPVLLPYLVGEDWQKEAAINAYLDLLLTKIETLA